MQANKDFKKSLLQGLAPSDNSNNLGSSEDHSSHEYSNMTVMGESFMQLPTYGSYTQEPTKSYMRALSFLNFPECKTIINSGSIQ